MFKNIWSWVKSPLLNLGKSLALRAVEKEGDKLEDLAVKKFLEEGLPGLKKAFDGAQAFLIARVRMIGFLPLSWKEAACNIIQEQGDKLEDWAIQAAKHSGEPGIRAAFDRYQAVLANKLRELNP